MQCSAPCENGSRCQLKAIGKSYHCQVHNRHAVKLYIDYKRAHKRLDKYNHKQLMSVTDVKLLMKYYSLLQRAYKGRLDHRNYAFSEDCFDIGHVKTISNLSRLIEETERAISRLWNYYEINNFEDSDEESFDNSIDNTHQCHSEDINVPMKSHQKMHCCEKSKENEINFNMFQFLQNNETYKLESLILKRVDTLTPYLGEEKKNNSFFLEAVALCVSNITLKADELKCFNGISGLKTLPNVFARTTINTIRPLDARENCNLRYHCKYSITNLKRIYELFLTKWDDIQFMFDTILNCMKINKRLIVMRWLYKISLFRGKAALFLFRKTN
jgi:hypothetical protein